MNEAVERKIYLDAKSASQGIKALTSQIIKGGFSKGSIIDSAHADRVLVPIGKNGLAAFQVNKNGTAKLKIILNAR